MISALGFTGVVWDRVDVTAPAELPTARLWPDGVVRHDDVFALGWRRADEPGPLRPPPRAGIVLEGRVLDHVGNGVEGVEIAGGAASFARTDAEGRFRVQTAPMVELWVLPPHRPPMRYLRALKADRVRATAEIRLEPGGQVVGRVVDAAGRIVPDADLLLFPVASGLLSGPLLRSITGEDGRFAATLDHRKWVLMVEEPGFAPVTVEGLHPLPGETRDLGDLTLVEGANLAGEVLDPEGRPVAGARVDLRPVFGNVPTRHYLRHNPYRTETDDAGRFAFSHLGPSEPWELEARHEAFKPRGLTVWKLPPTSLEIRLERLAAVTGTVVDREGRPVAGAEVRSTYGAGSASVRSDTRGRFTLRGDEGGTVRIRATKGDAAAPERLLEIAPGEIVKGLEIVLQPGALATLEGRVVTPSGEPAAGATVSSFQDLETWRTAAGGDGRYRLEGLPPGPRTVATTAEGFPPLSSEVDLSPGRNTLDLELVRGFAIAGRVQDREGRPVVQAGVGVYAGEARQGGATTDFEGRFEIRHVAPGSCRLEVSIPGFEVRSERELRLVDESVADLVLTFDPGGGEIAGKVVGLDTDRRRGLRVRARALQKRGYSGRLGEVDGEGRFEIRQLTPGEWKVGALDAAGFEIAAEQVTLEPWSGQGDGPRAEITLRYYHPVEIVGRVLSSVDSRPAIRARVEIDPISGPWPRRVGTHVGARGTFEFRILAGTRLILRVELDGYRRLEREILAREGEERIELELRLEPLSPPPP